jgi:hypothetical protein
VADPRRDLRDAGSVTHHAHRHDPGSPSAFGPGASSLRRHGMAGEQLVDVRVRDSDDLGAGSVAGDDVHDHLDEP